MMLKVYFEALIKFLKGASHFTPKHCKIVIERWFCSVFFVGASKNGYPKQTSAYKPIARSPKLTSVSRLLLNDGKA